MTSSTSWAPVDVAWPGWEWYNLEAGRLGRLMAITASEARKNLFPLIKQVNDDRAPIEITSRNGRAVLISADEWEAWQETAYLFRSPANARRLLEAAAALDAGHGVRRELHDSE